MTPPVAAQPLQGRRIAILVEEGFAARHVDDAMRVLAERGAEVVLVGNTLRAPYRDRTGATEAAAALLAGAARAADFDAVVVPGGHAPDRMRMRHQMVEFVAAMAGAGKPVAALCHGPQLLISADVLRGRTLTCWPSIAIDVRNAGGLYVDRPAVRDGFLITGRKGDDLPAFLDLLVAALTDRPAS